MLRLASMTFEISNCIWVPGITKHNRIVVYHDYKLIKHYAAYRYTLSTIIKTHPEFIQGTVSGHSHGNSLLHEFTLAIIPWQFK